MTLDARFIIASDLQSLFRDKDTGLPLSAGIITFYRDAARTTKKSVYQITGNPPDYTYSELPNPIILTAAGTFSDGGNPANDIVPYYFPYMGDPEDESTVVDLYYVTVESSGSVDQFVRVAWPNFDPSSVNSGENVENFIPNGQFLIHNDIAANPEASPPTVAGQITEAVTNIAQGGWTFERPDSSNATDIVTFPKFSGYVSAPTFSPRFSLNVQTTVASTMGDAFKYIGVKFFDVNKFASDTQHYNFYFEAQSAGSSFDVEIKVIKYFGTGGSPTTTNVITQLTIPGAFTKFNVPILFDDNSGKTIGDGSYVQIVIGLPVDAVYNSKFDNAALTFGSGSLSAFPSQTNADMMDRAVYGFTDIPVPDGSDLYLPVVLTKTGMSFDTSVIGRVVQSSCGDTYDDSFSTTTNQLIPDGKGYVTSSHSNLGIPMARLFAKYWNADAKVPRYGTGPNYMTAYNMGDGFYGPGLSTEMLVTTNKTGAVTDAKDGATATGFTIAKIHTGSDYDARSYMVSTGGVGVGQFYVENLSAGIATAPDAKDSTFTIATLQTGTSILPQIISLSAPNTGSTGLGGKRFWFSTTADDYYVWFKVNGTGADPADAGRIGIEVDLDTEDAEASVAEKVREALNGWQQTTVKMVAASAITGGAYFWLYADSDYVVWYKKDGAGAAPGVATTELEVDILAADTAAQVVAKTQLVINQYSFAVPYYLGYFLRAFNNEGTGDPDANYRFSFVSQIYGDAIGTYQLSQNLSHHHPVTTYANVNEGNNAGASAQLPGAGNTDDAGAAQSNPNNASVNVAIIY